MNKRDDGLIPQIMGAILLIGIILFLLIKFKIIKIDNIDLVNNEINEKLVY